MSPNEKIKIEMIDNWEVAKQSFCFFQYLVCNELDRDQKGQLVFSGPGSRYYMNQKMRNNLIERFPYESHQCYDTPKGLS